MPSLVMHCQKYDFMLFRLKVVYTAPDGGLDIWSLVLVFFLPTSPPLGDAMLSNLCCVYNCAQYKIQRA